MSSFSITHGRYATTTPRITTTLATNRDSLPTPIEIPTSPVSPVSPTYFFSLPPTPGRMAVGLNGGSRHAADEEARAEVDVLNSRLDKTTQLTKKIQACLGRLEETGKSVRDVAGPLTGETKRLQVLGNSGLTPFLSLRKRAGAVDLTAFPTCRHRIRHYRDRATPPAGRQQE